jgi:acetyltransferase-like isoleucine patch superfamily enzyme
MLIASFRPVETANIDAAPVSLFRERDCYYWKRILFKNVESIDPINETGAKNVDYIIIFDPLCFPKIDPTGIDGIFDDLNRRDPGDPLIATLDGYPFFIVSRGLFEKRGFSAFDSIEKLKNAQSVTVLETDYSIGVLDIKRDFLEVENAVREIQLRTLTAQGVIFEDLGNFYMEGMIPVGNGTRISTGVVIKGTSKIGRNVQIYPNCFIENSEIGDNCILLPGSIMRDSALETNVQIGPYTHLRNGAIALEGSKMGNFVEMKKSVLGKGSKSMHLAYIGDADVGEKVNIGAGTITCNYDGVNKNKTVIEDGAFIGSGTELIAPVVIKKNSYVAAGSTITDEVPENSLAVARQKQRNLPGWVTRKKNKKKSCNR